MRPKERGFLKGSKKDAFKGLPHVYPPKLFVSRPFVPRIFQDLDRSFGLKGGR
jgi:hypothetical protein